MNQLENISLFQIRYFLALAKELHFWNTAEKESITQSALSRQIKELEKSIGLQLFERTRRKVALTPAGLFLKEEWTRLLAEIESVHEYARQLNTGEIGKITIGHVGAVAYSLLPEIVVHLQNKFPGVKAELSELLDMDIDQSLLEYKIDIGFKRNYFYHPAILCEEIFSEPFMLAVPKNHFLQQSTLEDLSEVQKEKFILYSLSKKNQFSQNLLKIFEANHFVPIVSFESAFGSTILNLIAKGLGISILPYSYALSGVPEVRFIQLPYRSSVYRVSRKADTNPVLNNLLEALPHIISQFKEFQIKNNT